MLPKSAVFQDCIGDDGEPPSYCDNDQLVRLALFHEAPGG